MINWTGDRRLLRDLGRWDRETGTAVLALAVVEGVSEQRTFTWLADVLVTI